MGTGRDRADREGDRRTAARGGGPADTRRPDRQRLDDLVAQLGGAPRRRAGSWGSTLAQLTREAPRAVVNTVGPFTATGSEAARAWPPGTHYVDVANELPAVRTVLSLDRRAVAGRQVFVTGGGFGVLATESLPGTVTAVLRRPPRRSSGIAQG